MKKIYLVLFFLAAIATAKAQHKTLFLWPEGVPNSKKTNEKEKADTTNAVRISYVQNPSIDVYLPSRGSATGQAVIICPGGGYGILAYDKEGTDVAKWFNAKGIAGIVLKYRLPNSKSNVVPHKSPLMDTQQAMRLVKKNAAKWNIDTTKIGIMGFSAGGHLASTFGTHFDEDTRPAFMILIYPVVTMKIPITHEGSRNNLLGREPGDELVKYYSNETQVKPDSPATFIVHATDDKAVPVENSLMLYKALKDKNIPVEMHIYNYGGHGFGLAQDKGYLSTWPDRLYDWLKALE